MRLPGVARAPIATISSELSSKSNTSMLPASRVGFVERESAITRRYYTSQRSTICATDFECPAAISRSVTFLNTRPTAIPQ
jgi:hypothetical protein